MFAYGTALVVSDMSIDIEERVYDPGVLVTVSLFEFRNRFFLDSSCKRDICGYESH